MSEDLFYDRKKTVRTIHTMRVRKQYGMPMYAEEVRIEFVDGKFDQVLWTDQLMANDRNYWALMGAINAEIERIEQQFAAPRATAA